jgi:hypothetical protein
MMLLQELDDHAASSEAALLTSLATTDRHHDATHDDHHAMLDSLSAYDACGHLQVSVDDVLASTETSCESNSLGIYHILSKHSSTFFTGSLCL